VSAQPVTDAPGVGGTDVILKITGLAGGYQRGQTVVRDVSLELRRGDLVGVLGANGAGKSTLLRILAGLCRVSAGAIEFDGEDVASMSIRRRVNLGITLVPQGYALFPGLTIDENLRMGSWRSGMDVHRKRLDEVYDLLPRLAERRRQRLEALSGGERAMLAIGRSLMSAPRLLLLDEPSLGLSPAARRSVLEALRQRCESGDLSAIVAEQDVTTLARVATSCHVLRNGKPVFVGSPSKMTSDDLRDLYLGIGQQAAAVEIVEVEREG
jgi:branched-chain amino acid transport system ATP-binding protein